MRKQQLSVAVVAEREDNDLNALVAAFSNEGMQTVFIPVGDIVLSVESGIPRATYDSVHFDKVDAVYLQVPEKLMLFIEPFLTELTESGVYCQLKPTSFNLLASKPYLYTTLSTHSVKTLPTTLVSDVSLISGSTDRFKFPMYLEAFHGLDKSQRMIAESQATLQSFLKSLPFSFDVLTIREFLQGDLHESVVIGTDVLTTKRSWNAKELHHAKKRTSTKLPDDQRQTVVAAMQAVGCDIALVKSINGFVIGIEHQIAVEDFKKALSEDVAVKIAKYYKRKLT